MDKEIVDYCTECGKELYKTSPRYIWVSNIMPEHRTVLCEDCRDKKEYGDG